MWGREEVRSDAKLPVCIALRKRDEMSASGICRVATTSAPIDTPFCGFDSDTADSTTTLPNGNPNSDSTTVCFAQYNTAQHSNKRCTPTSPCHATDFATATDTRTWNEARACAAPLTPHNVTSTSTRPKTGCEPDVEHMSVPMGHEAFARAEKHLPSCAWHGPCVEGQHPRHCGAMLSVCPTPGLQAMVLLGQTMELLKKLKHTVGAWRA